MNTSSPLAWQADDHGTLMLHLSSSEEGPYVYLQGRRPYCDRGHWEWGSLGIVANHRQAPSYYFMRLDTAQAEVEAWLGRLVGQVHQGPTLADLPNEGRTLFQQRHGQDLGWAWAPGDKAHTLNAHAVNPSTGEPVVLTITETHGETGPLWTLTHQGVPNADDADRFPRGLPGSAPCPTRGRRLPGLAPAQGRLRTPPPLRAGREPPPQRCTGPSPERAGRPAARTTSLKQCGS